MKAEQVCKWKTEVIMVTGLTVTVRFAQEDIDSIFIPLLYNLAEKQSKLGRRMLVFIAAPPGCGKSTLVTYLEKLSETTDGIYPVQAVGMDGFHYHSQYLKNHTIVRDGQTVILDAIKGAPETFDTKRLYEKLLEASKSETLYWPVYSRSKHDVIEDAILINRDILLIEGNYLLLKSEPWKKMADEFCDYSIFMYTELSVLKPRLIDRKVLSGHSRKDAEQFYDFSDGRNAELVLSNRPQADCTIYCSGDRYYKE